MDIKEAKERLSFHSARNEDIHNVKWKNGFLGSLRPFCGELRYENFYDVMECLEALKYEIMSSTIDKDIVADIVSIVHLTRVWVSPYGMLGCNHLLTEEQTKHILAWCDIITNCFMYLLDDAEEEAFLDYNDYLNGNYF